MISKKTAKAINAQINREFYSAFLYLAMANDAMDKGFKGAANWFSVQFKEEQEHALKFAKYLQDQGVKVETGALEKPKAEWPDLLAMFKDALAHEKKVTAWICGQRHSSPRRTTPRRTCCAGSSTSRWRKRPTPRTRSGCSR